MVAKIIKPARTNCITRRTFLSLLDFECGSFKPFILFTGSKEDTKSAGYIPDNSPSPIIVRDMIVMLNGENT